MSIIKYLITISILFCASSELKASQFDHIKIKNNNYPIVLLHGFFGWGRDEVLGLKYWGGFDDIEQELNDHGFQTMTAVVGPFSSNWDRACEFYAYLKGGTVDYGEGHSKFHKHKRYGRTFPGIYPQWGELNYQTGKPNKIHLITHSQGGQTARMIVSLLENGHPTKRFVGFDPIAEKSKLFQGGNNSWIDSIITISTPHNGATLAEISNQFIPFGISLIKTAGLLVGAVNDNFYDFKVDQWGVAKYSNESIFQYAQRFFNSPVWQYSKDTCLYDLTLKGSYELNQWVLDSKNVYYYSWNNSETYTLPFTGIYLPKHSIIPLLVPTSTLIGNFTSEKTFIPITENWRENDGILNTISMVAPKGSRVVPYSKNIERGQWIHLGKMHNTDHWETLGIFPNLFGDAVYGYDRIIDWYLDMGRLVRYQR